MTRFGWLAVFSLLATSAVGACSRNNPDTLSTGLPSVNTAHAALQTGAPDVALAICGKITQADRRDVAGLECEGDALVALRRPDEAEAVYIRALILQPQQPAALLLRLGRLRLANDPRRAETLFALALRERPKDAVLWNDLGIAQDLQGGHAAAQHSYSEAIAADPEMRAAQVNLALSMALAGHAGDAARSLLPIASSPTASARERHDLAAVLAMDGRPEEARRVLQQDLRGAELSAALAGYRALRTQ